VAHFDRVIPPGGEGKITLEIRTAGYQGNVVKSARVETNERGNETFSLSVKAFIQVPILISSNYIYMSGLDDEEIERLVEVTGEKERPLSLHPGRFDLEGTVRYALEEVEKGRTFRIRFISIPGTEQTYQGRLSLKTNYPEKPEITIRIRGKFRKGA
jgi:hypothetical protein